MIIENAFVAVLLLASVTFTVKQTVPFVVGLPEIKPVEPFKVKPAGRLPELTDQTYGVFPPVAAKV